MPENAPWEYDQVASAAAPAGAAAGGNPWEADPVAGESFIDKLRAIARQIVTTQIPDVAGVSHALPPLALMKDPFSPTMSIEQGMENLPALAGTIMGLLGGPMAPLTGGIGATGGEAWRQNARRTLGLPAATGMIQRFAGMDPNSEEAAVAGVGAEALISPLASGASKLAGAISRGLNTSSLRSLTRILHPVTQRDQGEALELAARMREEGIAPAGSSRVRQLALANERLAAATTDEAAERARLLGQNPPPTLQTQPIQDKVATVVPANLPSGQTPRLGTALRKAATDARDDTVDALGGGQNPTVPLSTGLDTREALDTMINGYYEGGRENIPQGIQFIKNAADAWRTQIRTEFPEFGKKLLRKHDLLSITRMLTDALEKSRLKGGLGSESEAGNVVGAAATGRWSIPGMAGMRTLFNSGEWASLSAAGKQALSKIAIGGMDSAQAWMRVADKYNTSLQDDTRPEDHAIEDLALSMIEKRDAMRQSILERNETPLVDAPTEAPAALTEEDFVKRYQ